MPIIYFIEKVDLSVHSLQTINSYGVYQRIQDENYELKLCYNRNKILRRLKILVLKRTEVVDLLYRINVKIQ